MALEIPAMLALHIMSILFQSLEIAQQSLRNFKSYSGKRFRVFINEFGQALGVGKYYVPGSDVSKGNDGLICWLIFPCSLDSSNEGNIIISQRSSRYLSFLWTKFPRLFSISG